MYREAMEHLIAAPVTSPANPQLRQAVSPTASATEATTKAGRRGNFRETTDGETASGSAQPAGIADDTAGGEAEPAGKMGGGKDGCPDVRGVVSGPAKEGLDGDTGGDGGGFRTAQSSTEKGVNVSPRRFSNYGFHSFSRQVRLSRWTASTLWFAVVFCC